MVGFGGGPEKEIVRQQWNFSPAGSTTEIEDYAVDLDGVSVLELAIQPAWAGARDKQVHSLRFGAEYERHKVGPAFNLFTRGEIVFPGLSSNAFKDFLGGFFDLTALSITGSGVNKRDGKSYDLIGFANDSWRVSQKLTLNLGIRYEYFSPYVEAQGRAVPIYPARITTVAIAGLPPGYNVALTEGFVQAANATKALPGLPHRSGRRTVLSPGAVKSFPSATAARKWVGNKTAIQ
jgi:outer membrane receptor protein involved in Fe transport